jgi:ClpP class serine protease
VIRAIEMTGKEAPMDLVIHTPGGLVLAADTLPSSKRSTNDPHPQ